MRRTVAALLALSLVSCGKPIVKNPAFSTVNTLAVVSIYTNHVIYDIEEGKSNANLMTKLNKALGGGQTLADEHVQLATASMAVYVEEMARLGSWQVQTPASILENETYKSFVTETSEGGALYRAAMANYVTPPGMATVPFTSVVGEPGKTTYVDGKNPVEDVQKRLAQLASDLGVDGVAVIDVDIGYKRTALSGMSGSGLLSGVRGKAKPSVSSAMVIITKDGAIALQTPHISRGGGKRYEASSAPMLLKGKVDLTGDKGAKSIEQISVAVRLAAVGLVDRIKEELAGG
jgi:hypothetical protein